MKISYDAASRGPEVVALGSWLQSINIDPMMIRRVDIDTGRLVATIYTKRGIASDYKLASLPRFIFYRVEGLSPCGHHPEDSYGMAYCMSCKEKRAPWNGNQEKK